MTVNKKSSDVKVLRYIGFAVLLWILLFAMSMVSFAKEPEAGLHINSYYGSMEDGATWPEEFEEKVSDVLAGVNPEWSEEQKIIYLHDYLATNCDYDFEGLADPDATKSEGLYGIMVKKKGVCEDYSRAFREIAGRMGIQSELVGSNAMNHAWNLVKVDGEWFFMDCTWDDSAYADGNPNFKQFCDHRFLLKSQTGFIHGASDWKVEWQDKPWENAYGVYNTTTYDNACWNDSISPLVIYGDGFLVLKRNGEIYRCDSKGNNALLLAKVDNANSFGTIVGKREYVFVCNTDTIYRLNVEEGSLTPIYTLTSSEKDSGKSLYGIEIEGNRLRYDLAQGPAKSHYRESKYLDLENIVGREINGTGLNISAVTFYEEGTSYNLNLIDCYGNVVSADSWMSSDSGVAKVSADGVVTAVNYGKAVVTARKGDEKYYCTVVFDTKWQNDYIYGIWGEKYHISDTIFLDLFTGTFEENITVPAYAYVGGEKYKTGLRGFSYSGPVNGGSFSSIYLFPENTVISSISLEHGVSLDKFGYVGLSSCKNLKNFDFGGADLTDCGNVDIIFYKCNKLEFVNLSGCIIEHDRDAIQLLNNTNSIKRIITPAIIRDGLSIPFRNPLHVRNADGSLAPEKIKDLADAPRNTELTVPNDTTWQNDYEYRISGVSGRSGNYLCLDKYIGKDENIFVPAMAVVDGKEYPVCVRGVEEIGGSLKYASVFSASSGVIQTFAAEEGVVFDTTCVWQIFGYNHSVREVNLEGCDLSKTSVLYGPFYYSSKLEKVSFKGCNLGALTNATDFFTGCKNIKEIITPDVLADGVSISLPVSMYEKNPDGTTKEKEYTKLEDAPRGCTLVSEKKTTPDPGPDIHVHNITHINAKAATCTQPGNSEYWYCSECGKYFSDGDAKTETEKDSFIIAATGHKWNDGEITKEPTEEEEGIKTFTCENCGETKSEVIPKKDKDDPKPGVSDIFSDVKEDAWYFNAVQFVYDNNIMAGKGDMFKPNSSITRGEFARVLFNHSGAKAEDITIANTFPDVEEGKWYTNAILWAKQNNIANGNGDGTFGVNNDIQRQQVAVMLYKYAQLRNYDITIADTAAIDGYVDAQKVQPWAKEAMNWAVSQGIMNGKGGKLDPAGKATRAECASMIKKLLEKNP